MNADHLLKQALQSDFLTAEEGLFLFENVPTAELVDAGHRMRKKLHPQNVVTWIIDRNVNTTNVCIANCKFCNFYRIPGHSEAYITTIDQYKEKIEETFRLGGEQLLLQGGHHPDLGLKFYTSLFRQLKELYPTLKLHSLGPPEVAHITKLEGSTHYEVLKALKDAGLDSLPGAAAVVDESGKPLQTNEPWRDSFGSSMSLEDPHAPAIDNNRPASKTTAFDTRLRYHGTTWQSSFRERRE